MAYEYKPLRYGGSEIRLLTLFPSADPLAVVHCELEIVSLTDHPHYFALSYCWADPPDPKIIRLHGHDIEVTGNLYAALISLRDRREVARCWIDALCINQEDFEERSIQILRMASIYRTARHVVAWIGSEIPGQPPLHQYVNMTQELLRCESQVSPGIGHFRDFLSRKYWRRVWIVQEISVAADIWVVCGSSWVHWSQICDVMEWYEWLESMKSYKDITMTDDVRLSVYDRRRQSEFPREPDASDTTCSVAASTWTERDLDESYHGLQTFRNFRSQVANRTPLGFLTALQKTSAFLATDDRDRFYAILGLVYDGLSFVSIPDYKISFDNLQVQMARNVLQGTKNLDIIIARGHRPVLNKSLPSWTPDWLNLGFEARYVFSTDPDQKFRAAGDSTFIPPMQQQDPTCIQAEGLIFERLENLSTVYGELNIVQGEPNSLLQLGINEYSVSHTGSEWLRSFWYSRFRVRENIILDLYYCLEGGLDLVTSSEGRGNGSTRKTIRGSITSRAMWLYYGVDTTSEHDWWYKRFVARVQSKRRFDSPDLSMWLKDNRDLLIRGQTLQSLCKADANGTLLGMVWCSGFAPLIYIPSILSIFGLISLARRPNIESILILIGSCLAVFGVVLPILLLRFRWGDIKTAHILQYGLLEKMDKYMKQRRLRLATTGGGPGDATGWGGLSALVPGSARRGDYIAILKGCSIPVLLRENGDGYQVVGSVYLEKAMDGELMKWPHASWNVCKLY